MNANIRDIMLNLSKDIFIDQAVNTLDLLDSSIKTNYILADNLSRSGDDNRGIIFYSSTRNIFNVLFWFLILGPAGALAYMSIDFMINGSMKVDTQSKKKLKANRHL